MAKRLIDAYKLIEHIGNAHFQNYGNAIMLVQNAPTVNAVEVVRCKDCKHLFDFYDNYCCKLHKGLVMITEDSYCSYGERERDDE